MAEGECGFSKLIQLEEPLRLNDADDSALPADEQRTTSCCMVCDSATPALSGSAWFLQPLVLQSDGNTYPILMRLAHVAPFAFCLSVAAQNAWQLNAATGPGFGLWAGMAYALSTSKCYLYGGANGSTTSNETWEFDGSSWVQLQPASNPGERHTFAICYDTLRDVVVLFGGANNSYTPFSETWEFHPTSNTWTQATPAGAVPSARWGCHMVYDIGRGVAVLHGGYSGFGFTPDTWEWDGTTWTQQTTSNSPSPRDRFGFAYDIARGKCVLFGGIAAAASDETWEYDGVDWTQVVTPTTPPARQKVRLAFDAARGVCVMQGGQAAGVQLLDSWEYDGSNWRQIASTPTPARGENATAYDLSRNTTVVFGGYSYTGTSTQTWEYGLATSAQVHPFGTGCPGSGGIPSLQAAAGSTPGIGANFTMDIANLPAAGGFGYLFFGASNYQFGPVYLPFDTGIIGWSGCTGYVSPDAGQFFPHAGSIGSVTIALPNNPLLQHFTFYAQALSFDAAAPNGQVALSNAAELIIY